jgi:poly(A) polymerase
MNFHSTALAIVRHLREVGHEAYFAGGCVRDMLLKKKPKDYDVATSARPEDVIKLFKKTVLVGKAFGVVRVRLNNHEIEVATFRTEGPYIDGRRPSSVTFTTAEQDALRRDFTINGLFYDPIKHDILDYIGGRADLKRRSIRAIGDPTKRFKEDHLRLLRCVRFTAQLGFKIEPKTWSALVKMSPKIRTVSAERIRDELNKLLAAPFAPLGLKLLSHSNLMRYILPEIEAMHGVAQPRAFHPEGDVFVHTLKVVGNLKKPTSSLVWAALLHDVGKPPTFEKSTVRGRRRIRFPEHARVGAEMVDKILQRLRFSNTDREAIVWMVANHMTFKDVKAMRLATLKRLLARPTFEEELALHRADCGASHGKLGNVSFLKKKQRELSIQEIKPPRLIMGGDLIKIGLKPGPLFGQILSSIEEAQLEGKISSKHEALALAKKLAKELISK